jgi:hypothetical protein
MAWLFGYYPVFRSIYETDPYFSDQAINLAVKGSVFAQKLLVIPQGIGLAGYGFRELFRVYCEDVATGGSQSIGILASG